MGLLLWIPVCVVFFEAEGSDGSRIPHYTALYSSLLSSSLKYIAAFYGLIIMSLSYALIP